MTCSALMLGGMFLILTGYVANGRVMSVCLITSAVGCLGLTMAGHNANQIDLSVK